MTAPIRFRGITERGREVVEDTLEECVRSLAFVAGHDASLVVSVQHGDSWLVYQSQMAADLSGRMCADLTGWFAVVRRERAVVSPRRRVLGGCP